MLVFIYLVDNFGYIDKKTQTTKDLAKPWAQIPSLVPNQYLPSDAAKHNFLNVPQHSALTTILMDDSPLKAVLQPWNHLCVSEYGSERRKLDVEIAERELERSWLAERELERTYLAERELERTWLAERELERTSSSAERELERTRPVDRELERSTWPSERKLERTWLAEREMERTWQAEREHAKENVQEEEGRTTRDGTATDVDMAALKSGEEIFAEIDGKDEGRKRKRKEKKLTKKEKLLLAKVQQLEERVEEEKESYDELMLGVIGILDALKHQGNVAGWMRSGGLVHVPGAAQETILETTPETEEAPVTTTSTSMLTLSTMLDDAFLTQGSKRDSSTISNEEGPSKRRRLSHPQDIELDSDSEMVVLPTTPAMATNSKERSSSVSSVPSSPLPLHSSPPHSSSSPLRFSAQVEQALTGVPLSTDTDAAAASPPHSSSSPLQSLAQVEQALTGVPLSMVADTAAASSSTISKQTFGNNKTSVSTQTEAETQTQHQQPPLWYETPSVLSHWAQRGRNALAELGIEVIHGVVPPNQNG